MSNLSLALTFSLVILALLMSTKEKIGLEKDLIIASVRATIQLSVIGFILKYIFKLDNSLLTTGLLLLMVYSGSRVAAQRGQGIANSLAISFISILSGLVIVLSSLLFFGTIAYQPSTVIPISGMVVGNSMIAVGLVFNYLRTNFQNRKEEVEIKLCLGASPKEAALSIIRDSIRTAMLPTIDSMKTMGIVQLPGMMTGLILAGTSPEIAIKYQIMVVFMLSGAVAITSFLASFWGYKSFFTPLAQLKED